MSNSDVLSAVATQVVFIDSRTPDIRLLIADTAPGKRMFMLDAARNGVQQIADILAANNLTDLDTIAIVAHGRAGAIDLGSTTLDRTNLADHAVALSFIGDALAPGGDLALYACNAAAGAIGRQFIDDLSVYTGVDVAAATHVVGSAAHGGSWMLDAATGPIAATVPFSAAALANFQGALALSGQLWYGVNGVRSGTGSEFGYINTDGSNQTDSGFSPGVPTGFSWFGDIGLDTAAGLYFAINKDADNDYTSLVVGRTATGATIGTPILLNPNGNTSDYAINALAVDPKNDYIYIGIWGTVADSGIIRVPYNQLTGVVNNGNAIISGGVIDPSLYVIKAGTNFTNPIDFSLDVAHQKLYFAANDQTSTGGFYGGGYHDTNGVYVVDLATATPTTAPTLLSGAFTNDINHAIVAVAVNAADNIIYFATTDYSGDETFSTIYWMSTSGGAVHLMTLPAGITLPSIANSGLAYDPVSNQLIVSDDGNGSAPPPSIYQLQLDGPGTSFTSGAVLANADDAVPSAFTTGIAFNALATIGTLSNPAAMAVQGGSGITLLPSAPTGVDDSDGGGNLASATIKVSNGQTGDKVGVDGVYSFTTTPTNVSIGGQTFAVSYDSATYTLTIANPSGVLHTIAQFEAALAHITFQDTGTDLSSGAHPTRTVVWQVNDGANGNPTGAAGTNNTTTTITIDRAPVATADTGAAVSGGSNASGNVITNDTDLDGDARTVSAVNGSGGNVGNSLAGTYGHLTLNANGTYTYTADNTSAINGAANGSHPTDSFTYTVSDGNGGTSSTTLTITIDRAPTVVADTNTVVAGSSTSAANVLTNDSDRDGDTFTVTAVNGSGGNVGNSVAGTYGHITIGSNGSYSYAADNAVAIGAAATGSHLTDTFTYTANDGQGGTTTTTVTITLDRAPTVVADTNNALSGGAAVNGNVLTNDSDRDGDTLNVSIVNGSAGNVGTLIHGTYGDITLNSDGTYTYTAGVTPTQLSNLAGAGPNPTEHITFTVSDGHGGTTTSALDIGVETAPVITSITASGTDIDGGGNGDINAGHVVTLTVHMSSVVTVTGGVPTLALNDGGTATYTGGSGSDTLTFTYTVAAGHNTPDLAATSFATNGATIQDGASQNADFTTVPAITGTLQIDTTAATVSSVTTSGTGITAGSGDLNAGHVVTFTVNTSEVVSVDTSGGTPTLTLSNGATATYSGGSGSSALTFTYTVAAGQDTADLAVTSANLNGGTIKDGAGNATDLTGAATNPAGTLQIDTHAPAVSSVATSGVGITSGDGDLNAGHVVTFTVTLDEAVTVAGGTPTLTLNNGGVATYSGGSSTNTLTFTYTVAAGQDTSDLAVTGSNLNGATIKDAATNNADLSAAVTNPAGTLQIDTTAPTVSSVATSGTGITNGDGLLHAGDTVTFTVHLSEAVTVSGGVPHLTLNDGGVATYSGGSSTDTLTFTYTVAAGHNTGDLAVTGSSLNGATVLDAAGNAANLAGAATNPTGTLQVDTTAPTVSSVTTSGTDITAGSGDLNAGHVVTFTVDMSEVVTVDASGGTPTLTLNSGGVATYIGGSGSTTLTFTYTVAAGQNTPDLQVTAANLNGATIKDAATNDADLAAAVTNPAGTLQIDTTAAHVASVVTSGAGIDGSGNGILTIGNTVTFTVNMDEAVFVTGGPATLVLNNGGIATYSGGSGSTALTFTYTVASGENTSDLAVNSVNLNGATVATVQDAAFNDANLSGAVTNPAGTLEINTTAPTVASVTTSGAGIDGSGNGDLNAGHTVTFTVTLDESVTVAGGTPTLTLNNGGVATYSGGSGSSTLTFTYTVAAGQDTADLAVTAANLNGATIKDAATNDADLTAAVVNPTGTLHIDTTAPTVSSVATSGTGITAGDGLLHIGDTVTFTVSLSEAVTIVGGVPTLTLSDGGVATYSGGSGTNTLTFTHTVAAGQSTGDLAVTGSNLNGATVNDAAGNAANLAGATTNPAGTLQVDGIAPTVSSVTTSGPNIDGSGNGLLHIGDTVTFTVNLSEVVTVAGGTPTLTLNDGGVATYSSGTGTNVLTFTYTVAAGQNTADLAVTGSNLNGATVHDAAGNAADLSAAATNPAGTLQVDGTAPTVSSVTTSGVGIDGGGNGDLGPFSLVTFFVTTSEVVFVNGNPTLVLNDGGIATYTGGSGTNSLSFSYLVSAGENTSDLAVSATNLNGGTVKDAAGNAADLSGAVVNPPGTLQIDTTAPTVSSIATSGAGITAGSGNLNAGDVVTFTINLNEVVTVSGGIPALALNDGGHATYVSGSGTGTLTFSYTVAAGENTADLAVTGVVLNGATAVRDGAGNAVDFSGAITNPAGTLKIDTTAPTVAVSSSLTTLHAGDTATVTFTFSEAVNDFGLGDVLATGGSLSNLVHVGVNGSGQDIYAASFTPVATNTEVGQVQVNVSSYTDLAGNAGGASNAINYTGDTLKPHGTAVANPGSGLLMYGQTTHITLSFTEAVTFAGGVPVLTLNDGGHATYNAAATLALADPTKMVFDYTVGANDSSVSTLAITGLSGGNITDLAGNASDSLATSFNGLSVQATLITAHTDSNTVKAGNTVSTSAANGVLFNDTDTNPNDHLVVSAVNGSAAGVDHVVNGAYGSLTLHADGSYSYAANNTANGYQVDTFSYTASNGHGQTSTSTLSVGVYGNSFTYYSLPNGGGGYYGNVVLDGSAGNVTLNASNNLQGIQFLIGGPGDVLNGASYGKDAFVFSGDFGHNTVNNFQTNLDFIQLQQSQVGSIANVLADLHQVGADAVLTLDANHVVTITNMQVASLTAANFHLV